MIRSHSPLGIQLWGEPARSIQNRRKGVSGLGAGIPKSSIGGGCFGRNHMEACIRLLYVHVRAGKMSLSGCRWVPTCDGMCGITAGRGRMELHGDLLGCPASEVGSKAEVGGGDSPCVQPVDGPAFSQTKG